MACTSRHDASGKRHRWFVPKNPVLKVKLKIEDDALGRGLVLPHREFVSESDLHVPVFAS